MKPVTVFLLIGVLAGIGHSDDPKPAAQPARTIEFNRDVRPILADKCFACHGPDDKHRKADLRLDVEKDAVEAKAVVPGKPAESELVARITAADEAERMPPKKFGKPLTAAEIATLKRWVAEGATWSAHWAYVPPKRTPDPAVKVPSAPRWYFTSPEPWTVRGSMLPSNSRKIWL